MANVKISDLVSITPKVDDLVVISTGGVTRNAKVKDIRAVVNDLTTGGTTVPLSAEQGKVLYQKIQDVSNKGTYYGIKWDSVNDTITRTGSAVGLSQSDFNDIMPWAGIRRCNLADDLTVTAYYGDVNYREDGVNGQVMVEVPAFYYKRSASGNYIETDISMTALGGYKLHPWFYDKSGKARTKAYISAYEGSIYDASVGEYLLLDEQVADFNTDKLCSIANAKPCSGLTQNLTITNSRKLANNRGSGWEQLTFNAVSAIQMLFITEYASFNSQSSIGQGVVNLTDDGTTNMALNTGFTSSLGNNSGMATGVDGKVSVSYRGIENFWGDIWSWVDGFNIKDGFAYISNINGNFVRDKFDEQYIGVGELSHVNGYVSKELLTSSFDSGFIPCESNGTSTSKYADNYWQNQTGNFVARLGGRWGSGSSSGAFYWNLSNGSADRARDIGARACA